MSQHEEVEGLLKRKRKRRDLSTSEIVLVTVITITLVMIVQHFIVEMYKIKGASMEPTLRSGQRVIVTKVFLNIGRGDVVVFRSKEQPIYLVKRVVGMPGDPYILYGARKVLQPNEYFVMGDNRLDSYDSRNFGPINKDDIVGIVVYRWWPISEAGTIGLEKNSMRMEGVLNDESRYNPVDRGTH